MEPSHAPIRIGKTRRRLLYFYILLAGLALGCTSTGISVPPVTPAIERLAALASHGVRLSVAAPTAPLALGHQYLFVAIPFGSISLMEPQTTLFRALSTELAIAGIRALPAEGDSAAPMVTVAPIDLRLTAFDLIFTRRVGASVRLQVTVSSPDPTEPALHFEASGESGSFERFGFTPELSNALSEALSQAGRELVTALQSARRFRYDVGETTVPGPIPTRPLIRRAL